MRQFDYQTVLELTYPPEVKDFGGPDGFIKTMESLNQAMAVANTSIESFDVGVPGNSMSLHGKIYTLVPTTLRLKDPSRVLQTDSCFLAISDDQGSRWTFLDCERYHSEKMKDYLPNWEGKMDVLAPKHNFIYEVPPTPYKNESTIGD